MESRPRGKVVRLGVRLEGSRQRGRSRHRPSRSKETANSP